MLSPICVLYNVDIATTPASHFIVKKLGYRELSKVFRSHNWIAELELESRAIGYRGQQLNHGPSSTFKMITLSFDDAILR